MSPSKPLISHLCWLTAECIFFYRRAEYYRAGASFGATQQGCRLPCSTRRNISCATHRLLKACRESFVEITKSAYALHKLAVLHINQILLLSSSSSSSFDLMRQDKVRAHLHYSVCKALGTENIDKLYTHTHAHALASV
jgi:hypothetical protein